MLFNQTKILKSKWLGVHSEGDCSQDKLGQDCWSTAGLFWPQGKAAEGSVLGARANTTRYPGDEDISALAFKCS